MKGGFQECRDIHHFVPIQNCEGFVLFIDRFTLQ